MNEPYTVKRFPLASEFSRILKMIEDCEAELISAEYESTAPNWMQNMKIVAVFDGDEVVEMQFRARGKE